MLNLEEKKIKLDEFLAKKKTADDQSALLNRAIDVLQKEINQEENPPVKAEVLVAEAEAIAKEIIK